MKRNGLLIGLAVVLVACVIGMVALFRYQPAEASTNPSEQATLLTNYETVDALALIDVGKGQERTTIYRKDGTYHIDGLTDDMVEQTAAETLFNACLQTYISGTAVQQVEEDKLGDYGLDDDTATIITLLESGEGQNGLQFKIGSAAPDGTSNYCYVVGGSSIYLMPQSEVQQLTQGRDAYLSLRFYPSLADAAIKEIEQIGLTARDGSGYVLQRTRVSEMANLIYFDMTEPVQFTTGRENVANVLLTPLAELSGSALVSTDAADAAQYGLDDPDDTLTVTVNGTPYRALFRTAQDGTVYALAENSGRIFRVDAEKVEFLKLTYQDVIGATALDRNITTISNITLRIGDESHSYDVEGEGDGLAISEGGQPIDNESFMALFGQIKAISLDGTEQQDGGEVLASVTLTYRDAGSTPDTLELLALDDRRCALRMNGSVEFYTYRTMIATLQTYLGQVKPQA